MKEVLVTVGGAVIGVVLALAVDVAGVSDRLKERQHRRREHAQGTRGARGQALVRRRKETAKYALVLLGFVALLLVLPPAASWVVGDLLDAGFLLHLVMLIAIGAPLWIGVLGLRLGLGLGLCYSVGGVAGWIFRHWI